MKVSATKRNSIDFSEDIIRELIVNERLALGLKQQELKQAYQLKLKKLEVEKECLLDTPKQSLKLQVLYFISVIFILSLTAFLYVYSIYSGNKDIAMDLFKAATAILISVTGVFAFGKKKVPGYK